MKVLVFKCCFILSQDIEQREDSITSDEAAREAVMKYMTEDEGKAKKKIYIYKNLTYDVPVIQWITLCQKNHMTTPVITL